MKRKNGMPKATIPKIEDPVVVHLNGQDYTVQAGPVSDSTKMKGIRPTLIVTDEMTKGDN